MTNFMSNKIVNMNSKTTRYKVELCHKSRTNKFIRKGLFFKYFTIKSRYLHWRKICKRLKMLPIRFEEQEKEEDQQESITTLSLTQSPLSVFFFYHTVIKN